MKFKMSNLLCDKRGTSFVEIILYVAIVGMLLSAFLSLSLYLHRAYNKVFTIQEVHFNAQLVLDTIGNALKATKKINIDDSVFDSNPGELSLEMFDATIPIKFYVDTDNGALYMAKGVTKSKITDSHVAITNLVFTYLEEDNVEGIAINMTVEYPGASDSFQYIDKFSTVYTLR